MMKVRFLFQILIYKLLIIAFFLFIVLNAALCSGILAFSTTQSPLGSPPRPARKIHSVAEMSRMIKETFNQKENNLRLSDSEIEPDEPFVPRPDIFQRRHFRNTSLDLTTDFSPARLTR